MPDTYKKLLLQDIDGKDISHTKTNKLVRDKIPEIIKQAGRTPIVEILYGLKFRNALNTKLVEEVEEFLNASDNDQALEELADIFEVISALASAYGFSQEELLSLAKSKRITRGGFESGLYYKGDDGQ